MTIQLFRVVQECLTNIVRHAEASEASVRLEIRDGKHLCLAIADNGQGCTLANLKAGFGLLGMRERIKSLGGDFSIDTQAQQGLRISAIIPLS